MPRLLLAYDADCGPCTRFRHFVHLIDSHGEVDFISLIEADDTGLLDRIPEAERHTSFHLILPGGRILTGADAVPRLLELLPGGKFLAESLTAIPGGRRLISIVYAGFARGHNGSACRYPRPVAEPRRRFPKPHSPRPLSPGASRSQFLAAGLIGGLFGSLAMGLAVRLPDALCVQLAITLAGQSPVTYPLAWGIHFLTALVIGGSFGALTAAFRLGDRSSATHSVLLGLLAGLVVWAAFFTPLMLTFLPSLVTAAVIGASLAAHVLLGLVLGLSLALMLRWTHATIRSPISPRE